jgi:hypothetical protein
MECYIVGSGTGLDVKFLDAIKEEYSFSTNAIGSIYDRTEWRPTVYTLTSDNFKTDDRQEDYIKSMEQARLIFASREFNIPNATPITARAYPDTAEWKPDWFSHKPLEWVSKYGTSLLPAVQIAFWMGFDEIVFVGCNGYNPKDKRQHVAGYPEWAEGFNVTKYAETLRGAHELIAYHAKRKGIKVYFVGKSQFERIYD